MSPIVRSVGAWRNAPYSAAATTTPVTPMRAPSGMRYRVIRLVLQYVLEEKIRRDQGDEVEHDEDPNPGAKIARPLAAEHDAGPLDGGEEERDRDRDED